MSFVIVCLSLPLPLMVSCKLMYQVVTTSRFHSALPSSSCIHVLAGGVTKTRTSVYEVSFPWGKLLEIKFCLLNYIFSISVAILWSGWRGVGVLL